MLKWAIINALNSIFKVVEFLIVANALVSWFPMLWQNPTMAKIVSLVNSLTEPILRPVRKLLEKTPVSGMPVDLSPIIAILLLGVLQNIMVIIVAAVNV